MKTQNKHTPGPWNYTYDGSSDWSIGPSEDPQVNPVARIWDRNDERAQANAALISAAPELLAALRNLYLLIDKHSGQPPIGKLIDATELAQAAIAKAEREA